MRRLVKELNTRLLSSITVMTMPLPRTARQVIVVPIAFIRRFTSGNERCVASIRGACPPAWIQWGDKCYKAIIKPLTWDEAKHECIEMGSVLVMPQSQAETAFLLENLLSFYWIDCNDQQVEGEWVCQDGTTDVEYREWRVETGEPNNSKGREDCAAADKSGWIDISSILVTI
ncbi:ladderlectin-like [Patiria miniata]|uniref:C-type lectin domain-containing protein n=1 Tax=Patiria miniata TaxID=46514 RepID=A0A914AY51_PATMI|nr:ladderlectin-like [Patiria miniata]